ncbi:hypothetical protein ACFQ0M_48690 [Kitasatospora aburaviensis]|uniref:Uncharacterized protein n=1 Tax=Kitasatospora aburaviensis TaxID=67265 RepID=A0ABW1F6F7_9ACTN
MTDSKMFKKAVRERMAKTGEPYTQARRILLGQAEPTVGTFDGSQAVVHTVGAGFNLPGIQAAIDAMNGSALRQWEQNRKAMEAAMDPLRGWRETQAAIDAMNGSALRQWEQNRKAMEAMTGDAVRQWEQIQKAMEAMTGDAVRQWEQTQKALTGFSFSQWEENHKALMAAMDAPLQQWRETQKAMERAMDPLRGWRETQAAIDAISGSALRRLQETSAIIARWGRAA